MSSSSMRSVQLMRSTLVSEPLYSMTVPLKLISLLNMATTKFPFRRELDWLSDNAGIRNGRMRTANQTTSHKQHRTQQMWRSSALGEGRNVRFLKWVWLLKNRGLGNVYEKWRPWSQTICSVNSLWDANLLFCKAIVAGEVWWKTGGTKLQLFGVRLCDS